MVQKRSALNLFKNFFVVVLIISLIACGQQEKSSKPKASEPKVKSEIIIKDINWKNEYYIQGGKVDFGQLKVVVEDEKKEKELVPEEYQVYINNEKIQLEDNIWVNATEGTFETRVTFINEEQEYSFGKNITFNNLRFNELFEGTAQFDEIPVNINDLGYLVKTNGLYGFLDINGDWLIEPKYANYTQLVGLSGVEQKDKPDGTVCLNPVDRQISPVVINGSVGGEDGDCSGFGGLAAGELVYRQDIGSVVYYEYQSNQFLDIDQSIYDDGESYIVFDSLSRENEQPTYYYIYTSNKSIFGPYPVDETATSAAIPLKKDQNGNYNGQIILSRNIPVVGPFYVAEGIGYRIHDATGTLFYPDLVQDVKVLSRSSLAITTMDGQKGIIDQNLNLVVLGNFQEVAKPIGNKTLAKIDNKWQLIEI